MPIAFYKPPLQEIFMTKKILMVVAPENFRDEEYQQPKEVFKSKGFEVKTASTRKGEVKGMFGATAVAEATLDEVRPEEYDAVVFVGGTGARIYFDNKKALELAKRMFQTGKITAAICIAPNILANAGVLKGKRATVWADQKLIENMESKGAEYTGKAVIRDGNIITAHGPDAARKFGEKVAKALKD
jgi:protease I